MKKLLTKLKLNNIKRFSNSIKYRMIMIIGSIIIILLLFMFINNLYTINKTKDDIKKNNETSLTLFMSQIETSFATVETYLINQTIQNNDYYTVLNTNTSSIQWYQAIYNIQKQYDTTLDGHNMIDSIFMYSPEDEVFIDSVKANILAEQQIAIKRGLTNAIKKYNVASINDFNKWLYILVEEKYYLVRLVKYDELYIGCWVETNNLVKPFLSDTQPNMDYIFLCDNRGAPYSKELEEVSIPLEDIENGEYSYVIYNNEEYLAIAQKSEKGNFVLTALISDNNIISGLKTQNYLFLFLVIITLVVMFATVLMLKHYLFKPLNEIVDAMNDLKTGNLKIRVNDSKACEEFQVINRTFDDMITQIENLKISVYEQKLTTQKAELNYLQQQINPHFFINCLNVIRSLALIGKTELIQDVSITLGQYMRYSLHTGMLVTLEQESEHIDNYIKLQKLRYRDGLCYNIELEEDMKDVLIPTMCLQTFVDNSVKYQMIAGENLNIDIRVERIINANAEEDEDEFMRIIVKDSGEGFSEDILYKLHNNLMITSGVGNHIGIENVKQRLKLIYEDKARISFSNCEADKDDGYGGAKIEMFIPIKRDDMEGK